MAAESEAASHWRQAWRGIITLFCVGFPARLGRVFGVPAEAWYSRESHPRDAKPVQPDCQQLLAILVSVVPAMAMCMIYRMVAILVSLVPATTTRW